MKIKKLETVHAFLAAVEACEGGVRLHSPYGDVYNLKSKLSQYVAIAALLGEHGDELELFCDNLDDERHFRKFFSDYPEVLSI